MLRDLEHACPRCRTRIDLGIKRGDTACAACGFRFRAIDGIISSVPSEPANEWRKFFEGRAAAHDRNTSVANDYRSSVQQKYIVNAFRRACGTLPEDAMILDAGCGNGLFWQTLYGTRNVVGVDYSFGMCALARERGMRVYHADATALPFADEQFDLIYSAEILQCINELAALVREMARVCRTEGRIVVSTLNATSILRRAMRQVRRLVPYADAPAHTSAILREAAEIVAVGQSCSLSVLSVWWVHF